MEAPSDFAGGKEPGNGRAVLAQDPRRTVDRQPAIGAEHNRGRRVGIERAGLDPAQRAVLVNEVGAAEFRIVPGIDIAVVAVALVNIMVYDKTFATPELCQARSDAANACPEHLANFLDMLTKGGPINRWAPMDQLMKMQIPALLIHGRDDRVVPYEHSLVLCAHIPIRGWY